MSIETAFLGEIMIEKQKSIDPKKSPDAKFALYSIPGFDAGVPEICEGTAIGSTKKCLEPGDVVLSRIIPHIRRAWVVGDHDVDHIVGSSEWIVFRSPKFHSPYLRHIVTADPFHAQFMNTVAGVGGSLVRARPNAAAQIEIPLPPLEEQRRIAGILDAADALRRRRREALALLDTLPGAIFAEMFGDNPDSAGDWPTKKLGDLLADNLIGLVRGAKEISPELPVPYLKMDSITRAGRIDLDKLVAIEASAEEIEKYSVAPGDLLFNTRNTKELVGKSAVYHGPKGVVINNNVMRIRTTRETSPDFISGYLRSPFGYRQLEQRKSGTTSVFAVYAKSLMTLPVPVPPRDLIDEYDDRCRRMRDMRDHHVAHEFELKTLFASLQSRAFAGAL